MRNQYKVLAEKYDIINENRIENIKTSATKEVPTRIDSYGIKKWMVGGKFHRLDGPAVEDADGHKAWYVDGKLHRLDGPAVEWANGNKEWYVDGKKMSKTEFNIEIQRRNILKKASDETGIEMDI